MDLSICCNSLPKKGETINGNDFFMNSGGKGGNQAVASSKLGAKTYMIGSVGNDLLGSRILDSLKKYNVNADYVNISEEDNSGVALVIRHEHDNRIILGHGANYSLEFEFVKKTIDHVAESGDIFLTQLENEYELVRNSIIYAKSKGMFTILNPAPARQLDEDIYLNLDLLVINQSECETLSGIFPNSEEDYKKALEYFEKKNIQVVITLGEKGSITKTDKIIKIDSYKVDIVDTTGAGDSYIGALCFQLSNDQPLEKALKFASKVASIAVTRKGAQIAMPYAEELL